MILEIERVGDTDGDIGFDVEAVPADVFCQEEGIGCDLAPWSTSAWHNGSARRNPKP